MTPKNLSNAIIPYILHCAINHKSEAFYIFDSLSTLKQKNWEGSVLDLNTHTHKPPPT